MTKAPWELQPERSTRFWVSSLVWIVRHLGRAPARLVLWPVTAYFLLTSGGARRASADFLRRVFAREARWHEVARHFFTFAACTLDRILLLDSRSQRQLRLTVHSSEHVLDCMRRQRGCLVLVSHLGSFEALRVMAVERHLPLRILLDRQHGRILTSLIERFDPAFRDSIIDASERGPALALALRESLEAGYSVGIMADRRRGAEPSLEVGFLGGRIFLPLSPWIMASVLEVPVVGAFSLYAGGRDYDAHFELLAERVDAPRQKREEALRVYAQQYSHRLEHFVRLAPYNWFNFYPYWNDET